MPQQSSVDEIRYPADGVEYFSGAFTVKLWNRGSDGSLLVHPSVVINILPRIWEHQYHNTNSRWENIPDHCVPIRLLGWSGRWLVE